MDTPLQVDEFTDEDARVVKELQEISERNGGIYIALSNPDDPVSSRELNCRVLEFLKELETTDLDKVPTYKRLE